MPTIKLNTVTKAANPRSKANLGNRAIYRLTPNQYVSANPQSDQIRAKVKLLNVTENIASFVDDTKAVIRSMGSEERQINKVCPKLLKMVNNFEATITSALKGDNIPKLNTKDNSTYVLSWFNSAQRYGGLPEDMVTALKNDAATKTTPPNE